MMPSVNLADLSQNLALPFALFESLLLTAAGLHKLLRRRRLESVVQNFAHVPSRLAPAAVLAAAFVELSAGLLLCTLDYRQVGAWLAAAIFGAYAVLVLQGLMRGRVDVDCGCSFGSPYGKPQGERHAALNMAYLIRNLALLLGASGAALVGGRFGWGSPSVSAAQILPALALLTLYLALDQVLALAPLRAGELL